jgi:hypothetical protein
LPKDKSKMLPTCNASPVKDRDENRQFNPDKVDRNVMKSLHACKEVLIYDLEDCRRDLEMLTIDEKEI